MPTSLFSLSTTGIAPRSDFESRSIAVRASSLGWTLGTSVAMISPAVFMAARLFDRALGTYPRGDRVDHVAGDHRLGGPPPARGVKPGAGVGDNGGAGGSERVEPAGQQGGRDPREDVAAAGGGESRGGDRVDR